MSTDPRQQKLDEFLAELEAEEVHWRHSDRQETNQRQLEMHGLCIGGITTMPKMEHQSVATNIPCLAKELPPAQRRYESELNSLRACQQSILLLLVKSTLMCGLNWRSWVLDNMFQMQHGFGVRVNLGRQKESFPILFSIQDYLAGINKISMLICLTKKLSPAQISFIKFLAIFPPFVISYLQFHINRNIKIFLVSNRLNP